MSGKALFNYHSHSQYCDGKGSIEEQIVAAIDEGFVAFGISSHAPLPFACGWAMKAAQLPNYLKEVQLLKQKYSDTIEIYSGLEVDYLPEDVRISHFQSQLDYTIGSLHFIDTFEDGTPWEIDGSHTTFLKGLKEIFGGDMYKVIQRYFELTRSMVLYDCPDIVGHLDKLFIQNQKTPLFDPNHPIVVAEIEQTLETIAASNALLEVNTRGMYKKIIKDPYPSFATLQKVHKLKISITLSSDSHHPSEVAGHFSEIVPVLKEIGFMEVLRLKNKHWVAVAL